MPRFTLPRDLYYGPDAISELKNLKGYKKAIIVTGGSSMKKGGFLQKTEAVLKEAGLEKEFVIDSAGILSYHQGELPDSRMRAHAARRGYQLIHRSRPVRTEDFYNFDLIIGMDDRNIVDLKEKAPSMEEWKKIHRMTEYCTRIPADHVPDPYYGGAEGFEYVLDVLEDACAGLLTSLAQDS